MKMKKIAFRLIPILTAVTVILGTRTPFLQPPGKEGPLAKTIEEVLKEQTGEWMSVPGVVGTGMGLCDSQPCIKIYVIEKTPELNRKIPRSVEGYPVVIEETGRIRILPKR